MLDISDSDPLRRYLIENGLIKPGDTPVVEKLGGGVSCHTFRVICQGRSKFVIKQALPRLNVASRWLSSPARAHREALGIQALRKLLPGETVPALIFEDEMNHVLVIESVEPPHENWKHQLLGGVLSKDLASQFGRVLASIHVGAFHRAAEMEPVFRDTSFFETLRMEAYYEYTGRQVPSAAQFIENLLAETRQHRVTLVHGDYSPKNVLIREGKLILLDHETIHWGDPMFDIGFSLTHFLSKANHLPLHRKEFLQLAESYLQTYRQSIGPAIWNDNHESRAVRHTLACLLARVHGRSPLEYLSPAARERQASRVLQLMANPARRISALLTDFALHL